MFCVKRAGRVVEQFQNQPTKAGLIAVAAESRFHSLVCGFGGGPRCWIVKRQLPILLELPDTVPRHQGAHVFFTSFVGCCYVGEGDLIFVAMSL